MMIGKLMKTLLVTCVALTSSAFAAVWNGYVDVTAFNEYGYRDTFEISKPEHLAGLQKYVEDYGGSFLRKTVVLTADIYLNDFTNGGTKTPWIPMALSGNYLVKVGSYSKAVKIR